MNRNHIQSLIVLFAVGTLFFPSSAFSNNFTESDLNATQAVVAELNATQSVVADLNATQAVVADLNATQAVVAEVNATQAVVAELNATQAVVAELNATQAVVAGFNATEIAIPEANVTKAAVLEVNAIEIAIPEANVTRAVVSEVNATEPSVASEFSASEEVMNFTAMPTGLTVHEKFDALKAKAGTDKTVRVIVGLDTSFTPKGKLDSLKENDQKNKIKQDQNSLLADLSSYNVKKIHKFEHIPFIAISVDKKTLERLESSPMIASISEDVLHFPMLIQSVPLIGAPAAWSSGFAGQGQFVAILDSGVAKSHSAFAGKTVEEACYSTTAVGSSSACPGGAAESTAPDSALPCTANGCDHGTHVAGIAVGNDATIKGVAKDANIIAIQVFSVFTDAAFCSPTPIPCIAAYDSDIIKGMERVLVLSPTMNIASVNLSLGSGSWNDQDDCDADNAAMKSAVDNLKSAGIATVAASGNSGFTSSLSTPACISSVVSVGSTTDTTDVVSSFSNSAAFLDLLAPGQIIFAPVPTGYGLKSGTSMASPHVTGAFAILNSFDNGISVDNALDSLKSTGIPILDTRNGLTFPRIQVDNALNYLNAGWFDNAWQSRKEITINSAQVAADLTNFPVLISITDAQLGASALPNGDDIVFTSSDGVTKLSHEIESWDETPDALVAWVKGSVSSLANTKIFMYYGNSLATNQEDVPGTWNSNYKAVTHLHSDTADSTSNNNDGTNNGSTDGTGKIANGQTFDGINDDISFADNPSLDLGTAGTISIWLKSTDTKAANEFAVNWDQSLAGKEGIYAGTDDKVHAFFRNNAGGLIGGSSHGGTTNVDTNWRYVTLTYDGSASRVYVNGVQEKSNLDAGKTIASITNTGYLGKHPNNVASNRWEGGLDEFRVSNTARSAAWIQTEYNNQNNPGAFYTVGSEESSGGPTVPSQITDLAGTPGDAEVVLTWTAPSNGGNPII